MAEKATEAKKNDWALKFLAFVFAVMLWFYVEGEQNPITSRQFDVPVQYINQAENYVISDGVASVRVTVRGKETDLSSLRSDDFIATVDLASATIGSSEYAIQIETTNVMDRYSYQPAKTTLTVDEMQKKEVPIRVRTTGTLPSGYDLTSTEVMPEKVMISGLSKNLETISALETEVVDIRDMTKETTKEAALQIPEGITSEKQRVTIQFYIQEQQAHSNYEAPISLTNVPDGMQVTMDHSAVMLLLSGPTALLENERELSKIQVYVDCAGLEEGVHQLPVQVHYNGKLEVAQATPDFVTVQVMLEHNVDINIKEEPQENTTIEESIHTEGELN